MSHLCNYQHIVFRTYKSRKTIPDMSKMMLIKYFDKICADHDIFVKTANAHRNHVHLLVSLPSSLSVEDAVTIIKSNSTKAFKNHRLFPDFIGWAKRYGAFSVSYTHLKAVINYIDTQERHHEGVNFYNEFKRLVEKNGGIINEYFAADFGEADEPDDYV